MLKYWKLWAVAAAPLSTTAYFSYNGSHSTLLPTVNASQHEKMVLKQVQVVFRHGARAPVSWSKERFRSFNNFDEVEWNRDVLGAEDPRGCAVNYALVFPDGSTATGPKLDEVRAKVIEGSSYKYLVTSCLTIVHSIQLCFPT